MSAPGEPLLLRLLLLPISFSVLPTSERSIVLDCITHGTGGPAQRGERGHVVRGSRTIRGAANVRARGRDRSQRDVTDTLQRQTLATSASRGERPRAVVIVAKNLTGSTGRGQGGGEEDREEDASSRDEDDPLRGVRGSGTIGGGAESRPRRGEHTTHLSRFRERVQGERGGGRGERKRKRNVYVGERNEGENATRAGSLLG